MHINCESLIANAVNIANQMLDTLAHISDPCNIAIYFFAHESADIFHVCVYACMDIILLIYVRKNLFGFMDG